MAQPMPVPNAEQTGEGMSGTPSNMNQLLNFDTASSSFTIPSHPADLVDVHDILPRVKLNYLLKELQRMSPRTRADLEQAEETLQSINAMRSHFDQQVQDIERALAEDIANESDRATFIKLQKLPRMQRPRNGGAPVIGALNGTIDNHEIKFGSDTFAGKTWIEIAGIIAQEGKELADRRDSCTKDQLEDLKRQLHGPVTKKLREISESCSISWDEVIDMLFAVVLKIARERGNL